MRLEVAGSGVPEVTVVLIVVVVVVVVEYVGGGVGGGRRATEKGRPQRFSPTVGATDRRVDQQHRTAFCASKHVRSSHKPAISMDSGFGRCFLGGA